MDYVVSSASLPGPIDRECHIPDPCLSTATHDRVDIPVRNASVATNPDLQDPRQHTKKFFEEKYDEVVLVRDISFCSMCEHHMLPFMGKAHIGYMPSGRVIGLSKLARVVEVIARRPQVQERMTEEIANLLVEELDAKGVAVVIEASHSCMAIRGVRKPGSLCVTSAMKGIFRSNLSSRAEIMQLIYGNHS